MDRNRQREIASKGGKAAHEKGSAHEWTSEEAREAGRKGGMASHRRKQGDAPPAGDNVDNTDNVDGRVKNADAEQMVGVGEHLL
jgi:general stress protein YciG